MECECATPVYCHKCGNLLGYLRAGRVETKHAGRVIRFDPTTADMVCEGRHRSGCGAIWTASASAPARPLAVGVA